MLIFFSVKYPCVFCNTFFFPPNPYPMVRSVSRFYFNISFQFTPLFIFSWQHKSVAIFNIFLCSVIYFVKLLTSTLPLINSCTLQFLRSFCKWLFQTKLSMAIWKITFLMRLQILFDQILFSTRQCLSSLIASLLIVVIWRMVSLRTQLLFLKDCQP